MLIAATLNVSDSHFASWGGSWASTQYIMQLIALNLHDERHIKDRLEYQVTLNLESLAGFILDLHLHLHLHQ